MGQIAHKHSVSVGDGCTDCANMYDSFNTNVTINAVDEKPELLRWLSPLEPIYRHQGVRAKRHDGVGSWLLETSEFLEWRGGGVDKAVCFCYGEPGVGKTYLSSLVIDSLYDQARGKDIAVAGLYCDYQEKHEQTATNMMGAILKQLVVKNSEVLGSARDAFLQAKNECGGRGLRLPDLVGMLRITIALLPQVFICIDALDECLPKYLPELLESLSDIVRELPSVRVFLTGRSHIEDQVTAHFTAVITIPISPKLHDLKIYLNRRLKLDTAPREMDDKLRAGILGIIESSISKSFLLVSLSIDAILGEVYISNRRKKLNETTNGDGLKDAYAITLKRINAQEGDRPRVAMEALVWVAYSERPLQASELCHALGVEIGSTDPDPGRVLAIETLLGISLGLITLDKSSSTIRLVHSTLRDYLSNTPTLPQTPHSMIAVVCLTYLNFQSVRTLPPSPHSAGSTAPLVGYASRYWERHARRGMTGNVKSLVLRLLDGFGQHISSEILLSYGDYPIELRMWSLGLEQERFGGFTCLHWTASLGMLEMSIALLEEKERDLNVPDTTGKTAIAWAAGGGHTDILKILLEQKNIDPNIADNNGLTPLSFAAKYAHDGVARVLLEWEGINPDPVHKDGTTPLLIAAENWNVGILKMLLKRDDVNPNAAKNEDGRTPLSWAAWRGDKEVVKILLERKDINLDPIHPDGRTPLLWAVSKGHEDVVKLLLECKDVAFGLTSGDTKLVSSSTKLSVPSRPFSKWIWRYRLLPPKPKIPTADTRLTRQILIDCLVISVPLCLLAFLSWIIPSSPISLSPRR